MNISPMNSLNKRNQITDENIVNKKKAVNNQCFVGLAAPTMKRPVGQPAPFSCGGTATCSSAMELSINNLGDAGYG